MSKNSDVFLAIAVVGVMGVMIIPMPPMLLDILLSLNISLSLIIILEATYVLKPLELSSFPSIILLTTIFRLALNVATTRIILLHGNEGTMAAGKVIQAFGTFVVGGNYIVGSIVFIILVIINFVVITKGSGRIAEVAARFTLDAMPGKQMSIDADLNAGIINEQEARARRLTIANEADFYGSMDGASKFVRGDAIAGVIITIINIIGGLAIGVVQNKMTFSDAAANYTIMTVGDGLVSQIPALILSTAAGIIVTRMGSETNLGEEIISQLFMEPRVLGVTSVVLFTLALIPGLPTGPFIFLALITTVITFIAVQNKDKHLALDEGDVKKEQPAIPDKIEALPPVDILTLEVGYALISLVDVEQNGELLDRIRSIRRQIAKEVGILVSPVHIKDNMNLKPGEYSILLKGIEVARDQLMVNHMLAMDPEGNKKKIEGIPAKEPTYGLPAVWIKEHLKDEAMTKGYTVVDLSTVLTTHLSEIIKLYAHELLGRQEVQELLDSLKESHPKVIEELVPNLLPLGGVVKVLQNLLRERIPVRDLLTILETLADWAPMTKDIEYLTEQVRQSLARTITNLYKIGDDSIPVIALDSNVEEAISSAIQETDQGSILTIEPNFAEKLISSLSNSIMQFSSINAQPIVICAAKNRSHLKKIIDRFIPNIIVLSYNEILNNVKIKILTTVRIDDAN